MSGMKKKYVREYVRDGKTVREYVGDGKTVREYVRVGKTTGGSMSGIVKNDGRKYVRKEICP